MLNAIRLDRDRIRWIRDGKPSCTVRDAVSSYARCREAFVDVPGESRLLMRENRASSDSLRQQRRCP